MSKMSKMSKTLKMSKCQKNAKYKKSKKKVECKNFDLLNFNLPITSKQTQPTN